MQKKSNADMETKTCAKKPLSQSLELDIECPSANNTKVVKPELMQFFLQLERSNKQKQPEGKAAF